MREKITRNRATRPPRAEQRLLTPQQASLVTGIPHTTLRDLVSRGTLPSVQFPGMRRIWLRRADIDHLIERSTDRVSG